MNEMGEKVARAMFDAEWLDSGAEEKFPGKADQNYGTWKRRYRLETRAAILETVKQAMAWRITKRMAGSEPTCDELLRHLCDAALKEG
jgi:hypothetical protein